MVALETAVLIAGLAFAAYLAGLFLTYGFVVMPGLGSTDDRSFVAAFQGLERLFQSPPFDHGVNWPVLLAFPGLPLVTIAAIAQNWSEPQRWWLVVAMAAAVTSVVITVAVHLPLNNALSAAGDPATIDVAAARSAFNEARWRTWNHVRAFTSIVAAACFLQALLTHTNANA